MAVLETIRVKFGILITVLIAVALLSFIIDPSTLQSVSASMSSKEAKQGLSKALLVFDEILASDTLTVRQLKLLVDRIVVKNGAGIEVYMNGNLNEVMRSHVDISLTAVDIYKKAIIDKAFEMQEFYFQDLHKEVAKMGYKEGMLCCWECLRLLFMADGKLRRPLRRFRSFRWIVRRFFCNSSR